METNNRNRQLHRLVQILLVFDYNYDRLLASMTTDLDLRVREENKLKFILDVTIFI
jgi:hypothetical protein